MDGYATTETDQVEITHPPIFHAIGRTMVWRNLTGRAPVGLGIFGGVIKLSIATSRVKEIRDYPQEIVGTSYTQGIGKMSDRKCL